MKNTRLRVLALSLASMLGLIAGSAGLQPMAAAAAASITITTAYTTGYTYFDNSPPGVDICCGVIHQSAGGMGTYADPITLAAGLVSQRVLDYPAGTRFYMSDLHRYFIVEDSCGSVGTGCHVLTNAPPGATTWVDMWVGGTANDSQSSVQACSSRLTDSDTPLHTIIENPPTNLPVVAGPLFQNGQCTALYGNGQPPANPPPANPPPANPPPNTPPLSQTPASQPAAAVAPATPNSTPSAPGGADAAVAPSPGRVASVTSIPPESTPIGPAILTSPPPLPASKKPLNLLLPGIAALLVLLFVGGYWVRRILMGRARTQK